MSILIKEIESLLLSHDCVIVQQLGGFIAVKRPARFCLDDGVYYPPYRTVTFNQELKESDGLLASRYMQVYDATYPQAVLQVEKDVDGLLRVLEVNGEVNVGDVGVLRKDLKGHIALTPHAAGIDSPELYGLSALSVQSWKKEAEAETRLVTVRRRSETEEGNVRRMPLMYDMSVAAAIAAIFFLLFASPMMESGRYDGDVCVAGSGEAIGNMLKAETETAISPSTTYAIVLACHVSEKNALGFVESLKEAGFADGRFVDGRVTRVLYGEYFTETEAMNALKQMKGQHRAFADGWVMQVE